MDQSEKEAIRRLIEQDRRAKKSKRPARPISITLIAGLQFLKAVVLLLTGVLLKVEPNMVSNPDSLFHSLLYVATRGRYDSLQAALQGEDLVTGVVVLLGLYLAAIGLGLLHVNAWARRTLIFSCGLTLALAAKSSLSPDLVTMASPDMTRFYVLLALDAVVFVYMLRWNTVEIFSGQQ